MSSTSRIVTITQYLALVIVTFILLIVVEIGVMALLCSSHPNSISFPSIDYLPLYQILWAQNAIGSLEAIASQPVMLINHVNIATTLNEWVIYYYPATVLLHFVIAIYTGIMLRRMATGNDIIKFLVSLFTGTIFLILSMTYVSVAAHCSGPVWSIDVMLRSLIVPTNVTASFWQSVYPESRMYFFGMQFFLVLAGVVIFVYISMAKWKERRYSR